jgi:dihydroxyacid dehydratase/phosphogluconate dehydratase
MLVLSHGVAWMRAARPPHPPALPVAHVSLQAFENAMVLVMALGGSTNAVLHYIAMAR